MRVIILQVITLRFLIIRDTSPKIQNETYCFSICINFNVYVLYCIFGIKLLPSIGHYINLFCYYYTSENISIFNI